MGHLSTQMLNSLNALAPGPSPGKGHLHSFASLKATAAEPFKLLIACLGRRPHIAKVAGGGNAKTLHSGEHISGQTG